MPDVRLLDAAIIAGLVGLALGHRLGREFLTLAGGALLGAVALAAVLAVRRLQRDLARRPALAERPHRTPPTASVPARDHAAPPRFDEAIGALAAQLRSTSAGNPRREQALTETLDRFVAGHGGETASHTLRVGEMARELALLAGLPAAEAELLRQAAPLHDLGQAGIPAAILDKPGRFTAREFALMKKHTIVGHRILSRSDRPVLQAAATIALQHHERWDGMGYPQRLQGEDIHVHARIVGLVDAFDAMFCRRSYRRELTLEQALGIIRTQRGHHFEPRLHDLFMDNLQVFTDIIGRHPEPITEPAPRPRSTSLRPPRREPVGVGAPSRRES